MNFLKHKMAFVAAIVLLAFALGCGLFGGGKVENAVINSDIGKQELNITEGVSKSWYFKLDEGRCFELAESEYAGDTAKLTLKIASYYESEGVPDTFFTVFGKVVMNYKWDGKSWTLERVESKELIQKILSLDEFKKFLDISEPLCRSYRAPLVK